MTRAASLSYLTQFADLTLWFFDFTSVVGLACILAVCLYVCVYVCVCVCVCERERVWVVDKVS